MLDGCTAIGTLSQKLLGETQECTSTCLATTAYSLSCACLGCVCGTPLSRADAADNAFCFRHRGTRLKDMKWFWELELLPKDASVSLGISDKSGADYSPPPNYVLRTDARYVMAQPAAGSVQNDGQQGHEYEQCDSASPTNPGSPRNRRQSVWSALGSGVSGEGSNDAEAGVRR